MQQRLGAARRGQARLDPSRRIQAHIFLSHKLGASRHFLVISDHITDCFGGKGSALDSIRGLQTHSRSFPFPLSLGILHSDTYCTCKSCIFTNASSKEEPRNFLIYHYITAQQLIIIIIIIQNLNMTIILLTRGLICIRNNAKKFFVSFESQTAHLHQRQYQNFAIMRPIKMQTIVICYSNYRIY